QFPLPHINKLLFHQAKRNVWRQQIHHRHLHQSSRQGQHNSRGSSFHTGESNSSLPVSVRRQEQVSDVNPAQDPTNWTLLSTLLQPAYKGVGYPVFSSISAFLAQTSSNYVH